MNREEILAKSREENKDRDLYELSIEKNAGRVGVIAMYSAALILTIINLIQTGHLSFMLWVVALTVDTSMDVYKAIKLKTKKSIITAVTAAVADIAMTLLLFRDLYGIE